MQVVVAEIDFVEIGNRMENYEPTVHHLKFSGVVQENRLIMIGIS